MGRCKHALTLALAGLALGAAAQTLERQPGLREAPSSWHAFTDARLVLAPGEVVERGTLLVKDGRIVAVGANVAVPAGARVWPLAGRSIYAGFIDLASPIGVPEVLRERSSPAAAADPFDDLSRLPAPAAPSGLTQRSLALRNPMLRAEQQVATQIEVKPEQLAAARQLGFGAVLAAPSHGLLRGQGALLALRDPGADASALLLAAAPSQQLGLDPQPRGQFPTSQMGAMALLRQSLLDAGWLARTGKPALNATLAALQPALRGEQLVVAQARDEQDLGRWLQLRDELAMPAQRFVLHGTGHEYRQLPLLRRLKPAALLLPLTFPEAPETAGDAARALPLHLLEHWEAAPSSAAWLHGAGLRIAFTAAGLGNPAQQFWPRLRQAVRRGLPADAALAALTTTPAALLGESARLGSLAPGKLAHAVVMSADPFSDDSAEPLISLVGDQVHLLPGWLQPDPRGRWQLADGRELLVAGSRSKPSAQLAGQRCTLALDGSDWQLQCAALQLQAQQQGERLVGLDAQQQVGSAQRLAGHAAPPRTAEPLPPPPGDRYPFGAYGVTPPALQTTLIRGATVWTQGPAGRLANTDVLLSGGRIAAVGSGLALPAGATLVEASGMHLTPGLIDAHSHIAIARGINEASDSVVAEVRVADVLDATDINLYRQLAGGVTTSNLLHGSANTIGGQSAVIKLRWGERAAELLMREAPPSIKFALGENVKQAAALVPGTRYPQTRMGVEQLLVDAFEQARDYARLDARTRRRDLRLEALAELLAGTRSLHVHSYRADEILMFARLAKTLGLKVAAFQHVLEGYKVAAEIAALGAGASTFSDWWGFKAEAFDAVPGNAAMLHRAGVLTSLNSDDAELARRLNTEAAKAVRHGGLAPEQALDLVTINPARQLGIAAQVGSIEPGKQADVVLWNGPPLSSFSLVRSTWVDGRLRFDRQQDALLRQRDARERERLLQRLQQPARPEAAAPALQALLEQSRALAHIAHADYHDGQAAHECTESHQP